MISKELAKVVLSGEYNVLRYSDDKVIACYINIHELVHKCKEWAYKTQRGNIDRWLHPHKNPEWRHTQFACYVSGMSGKYVFADTEPEAIFKACEWIMENKDD